MATPGNVRRVDEKESDDRRRGVDCTGPLNPHGRVSGLGRGSDTTRPPDPRSLKELTGQLFVAETPETTLQSQSVTFKVLVSVRKEKMCDTLGVLGTKPLSLLGTGRPVN